MNRGNTKGLPRRLLWAVLAALAVWCWRAPAVAGMDPGAEDAPGVSTNAYVAALTALYEATGQPPLGQELVARVVANRAALAGAPHWESVAFAGGQFAAWTDARKLGFARCQIEQDGDPACFDAMALERLGTAPDARERWLDILAMGHAVALGAPEPRGWEGALNFDNPLFWPEGEPPWAPAKEKLGCICDHCFYR